MPGELTFEVNRRNLTGAVAVTDAEVIRAHYLARYGAAIVHGGTGITYSCIQAGVPMLVWPHDFDQHDHAARIVDRGLGLRLRASSVVDDLRRLLDKMHACIGTGATP